MEIILVIIVILLAITLIGLLIYESSTYHKLVTRIDSAASGFSTGISAAMLDIIKLNQELEKTDQRVSVLEKDTILIETVIEMHTRALQLGSLDKLLAHAELKDKSTEPVN